MRTKPIRKAAALALCSIVAACESHNAAPTDPETAASVVLAAAPICRGQVATIYPGAPSLPA